MKKLASTLPNMLLSLGAVTIVAGALLGAMYSVTKGPIEEAAGRQLTEAIAEVTPPFNNNPEADKVEITVDGQSFALYPAYEDGRLVGAAVTGVSMDGFSGEIDILCGFCFDGSVKDYRVLSHAETPGLGAKMEMWFRDPSGARSVLGRSPGSERFAVTKDGGAVDAITAATISSRAFLDAMRCAYMAYREYALGEGVTIAPAM